MEGAAALLSSQTRPGLPSSPPRRRRLACRLAGIAAALLVALVAAFWPGDLFWPGSAGPPPLGGGSEGSASATAEGPRLTKCPAGVGVADLAAADVALPAGHPPTGGAAPSADGDIGGAGVAVEELRRPTLFSTPPSSRCVALFVPPTMIIIGTCRSSFWAVGADGAILLSSRFTARAAFLLSANSPVLYRASPFPPFP